MEGGVLHCSCKGWIEVEALVEQTKRNRVRFFTRSTRWSCTRDLVHQCQPPNLLSDAANLRRQCIVKARPTSSAKVTILGSILKMLMQESDKARKDIYHEFEIHNSSYCGFWHRRGSELSGKPWQDGKTVTYREKIAGVLRALLERF